MTTKASGIKKAGDYSPSLLALTDYFSQFSIDAKSGDSLAFLNLCCTHHHDSGSHCAREKIVMGRQKKNYGKVIDCRTTNKQHNNPSHK